MKLLFDENLAARLVRDLTDVYRDCTTGDLAHLLRSRAEEVRTFADQEDAAFMELG